MTPRSFFGAKWNVIRRKEFEMVGLKNVPGTESASNFPKYRRLYSWIMIGAAANYLIHFVGVPVIPTDIIRIAWICDFELCDHFGPPDFDGESAAFLSLIITIRIQLVLCLVFIVFLTARHLINLFSRISGAAVESWRIYLSALFMTIVCSYYVGSDTFSLQWFERKPPWLVLFLVSCMTAVTMVSLVMAALDATFMARISKSDRSNPKFD